MPGINPNANIDAGLVCHGQGRWTDVGGQVNLLGTIEPSCATAKTWTVCPASTMPLFAAHMALIINDLPSSGAWAGLAKRFGNRVNALPNMTRTTALRIAQAILAVAQTFTATTLPAIALVNAELAGSPPTPAQYAAAINPATGADRAMDASNHACGAAAVANQTRAACLFAGMIYATIAAAIAASASVDSVIDTLVTTFENSSA